MTREIVLTWGPDGPVVTIPDRAAVRLWNCSGCAGCPATRARSARRSPRTLHPGGTAAAAARAGLSSLPMWPIRHPVIAVPVRVGGWMWGPAVTRGRWMGIGGQDLARAAERGLHRGVHSRVHIHHNLRHLGAPQHVADLTDVAGYEQAGAATAQVVREIGEHLGGRYVDRRGG